MDAKTTAKLLDGAKYQFAKTMPETPHYYTLRQTWADQDQFKQVVQAIRDNGEAKQFGGRTYIYFYANGFQYWTMGAPLDKTILINRAEVEAENDED